MKTGKEKPWFEGNVHRFTDDRPLKSENRFEGNGCTYFLPGGSLMLTQ
jgi:hypothetical protein